MADEMLFPDEEHPLKTDNAQVATAIVDRLDHAIRQRKDMTQQQISERMGISDSTFSKYKREPWRFSRMQVLHMCHLLGVRLDWLRYGEHAQEWELTPEQLLRVYQRMDAYDRQLLSRLLLKIAPEAAFDDVPIGESFCWTDVPFSVVHDESESYDE